MAETRDMSKKEFGAACERRGFEPEGVMGYYRLNLPGRHHCVSVYNAGDRRRDQLAYLIREQEKAETSANP